jgi:hypothetical protein
MEIPSGDKIPWGSATVHLTDSHILGHGLHPGDYFEFTMQRLSPAGSLGVELFDSDQLRQGSGISRGPSSLESWTGKTWTPISIDSVGHFTKFNWSQPHTVGVHFTSADGNFATFAYYVDGQYAGSWIIRTKNRSLDRLGFYCQSDHSDSRFMYSALRIYGNLGESGK